MNPFYNPTAILEAAKVPPGTLGSDTIARKIMDDGEVRTIALQLAIDAYVLEAIGKVNLDRLHKRIGIFVAPPKPTINWSVELGLNGLLIVRASVPGEFMVFAGIVKNVAAAQFHSELIPQSVLDEYKQRYAKMFWVDDAGLAWDHNPVSGSN